MKINLINKIIIFYNYFNKLKIYTIFLKTNKKLIYKFNIYKNKNI